MRRSFLHFAGITSTAACLLLVVGCDDSSTPKPAKASTDAASAPTAPPTVAVEPGKTVRVEGKSLRATAPVGPANVGLGK